VLREELSRIASWEERHRRLVARLLFALTLTLIVDLVGAILIYAFENDIRGGGINGFGDALFFSTVQLLTVSSQIRNPLTAAGRIVDVVLEMWAIVVVAGVAGSFAAFFNSADAQLRSAHE
jgi:H+/Cl- antiporter ClcA